MTGQSAANSGHARERRVAPVSPELFAERFGALTAALTRDEVETLLGLLEVREVSAGETLIGEGTVADGLFLVWQGSLNVVQDTPSGETEIATVVPGAYLGEISMMDPGLATASVQAQQGCIALVLSRARFDHLCATNAGIAAALLQQLTHALVARIGEARGRLDSLLDATLAGTKGPTRSAQDVLSVHTSLYGQG